MKFTACILLRFVCLQLFVAIAVAVAVATAAVGIVLRVWERPPD